MKRVILIAALFMALLVIACPKRHRSAPISTSTGAPTMNEQAPVPVPLPEAPPSTAEANIAATPPPPIVSPKELIISTAESKVSTPTANLSCFRHVCLGMSPDEVTKIVTEDDRPQDPSSKCRPATLRELPLPTREPDVKRYIYYYSCGSLIDQITFHLYKSQLTKVYFYFNGDYLKGVTVNDFLAKIKGLYGETKYEKWGEPGIHGFVTWEDDKAKITLEFYSRQPFVLKIEKVPGENGSQPNAEGTSTGNSKRLEGVLY